MELIRFKRKNIRDVLSWIDNESQMVQWAGPILSWPLTQKQFRKHLEMAKPQLPTLHPFGLYHRSEIIGYCELWGHHRRSNSAMASRIIISPRKRNKGFGQFMLMKLLEFGFDKIDLNRIGLAVFDFNKPAVKCYKNAGFVLEGTLRQSARVDGSYWDCHLMGILRQEWNSQKPCGG